MTTALREDFVASAVTFLLDPKAATSPLAQRIQFLESKGLTEPEIVESLRRAKGHSPESPQSSPSQPQAAAPYAPPRPSYYPPPLQAPPPRQNWKDLFVLATASAGVTYGMYILAKRYVLPLILPPSPPALEADKEAIAAEFGRAEQLLQQIQSETESLKESEQKRLEALDVAVEELHQVLTDAKKQLDSREREMRQLQAEIETVRNELPRFLERAADGHKQDLSEIQSELRSLKQILSNRVKAASPSPSPAPAPAPEPRPNGSASVHTIPQTPVSSLRPPARAGIPAWQLAAASNHNSESSAKQDGSSATA